MTMPRQVEIVDELVQDAIKSGAKVLAGGHRDTSKAGLFYLYYLLLLNMQITVI